MAGTNGDARWIALDGAANARVVVPGVLLRSDNLQSLTDTDVRLLVDEQALEVVLDLRTDLEVELEGPGPITTSSACSSTSRRTSVSVSDCRLSERSSTPGTTTRAFAAPSSAIQRASPFVPAMP